MTKFDTEQQNVFNAFEDFKRDAIPREQWGNLQAAEHLRWSWDNPDNLVELSFSVDPERIVRSHFNAVFGNPRGWTHIEFMPSTGRILHVDRRAGDLTVGGIGRIFVQRVQELFMPSVRPVQGDYEALVKGLEAGTFYYRHILGQE